MDTAEKALTMASDAFRVEPSPRVIFMRCAYAMVKLPELVKVWTV